ncbi:MAG: GHKL domain-containing protein, partial [Vallitaleaceae bacterium]|nr:GHKL domain-containing protein [Vallitaleaceae bacterium]
IKYTEKGSVSVSLRLSSDKESIILKISDTGIGIPEEDQERIFERFYRVDKGRSRKMGGTGLGLSIVKHIVELYQGQLELKSQMNVGTTIRISFPING